MPDYLMSLRQRSPHPIDKRSARRMEAGGGYDVAHPMTLAPGLETELPRYPGTVYDAEIVRERRPWYSIDVRSPVGDSWVDWTAAGPPRPELHMRTTDWREEQGASKSRFPFDPNSPTGGRHTMVHSGVKITTPRYVDSGNPQMRGARINRLSNARYAGQSYSQTTAVQGRAVRR